MADELDAYWDTGLTNPSPCGYIKGNTRRDMFVRLKKDVDISDRIDLSDGLLTSGFSYAAASEFYMPMCEACDACVPIRYPVADFRMSKSQWDLWRMMPLRQIFAYHTFESEAHLEEHREIATMHHKLRFPEDEKMHSAYNRLSNSFFLPPILPMRLVELRDRDGYLVAGSVNLEAVDGLYGVFYYYDTSLMHLQPGKQMILSLLKHCHEIGKDYLYVGAWNRFNHHLAIKTQFRPYELLRGKEGWVRHEKPIGPETKTPKPNVKKP
ncbi:MAG: GNAT family N-acetyltransferase [Alphaproteobacteria bacterium]|nr:GNAT family N-acetyltransferase [Alphaproteobacteria bacterium]